MQRVITNRSLAQREPAPQKRVSGVLRRRTNVTLPGEHGTSLSSTRRAPGRNSQTYKKVNAARQSRHGRAPLGSSQEEARHSQINRYLSPKPYGVWNALLTGAFTSLYPNLLKVVSKAPKAPVRGSLRRGRLSAARALPRGRAPGWPPGTPGREGGGGGTP